MRDMREIKIEKITLNVGAGKDQTKLDKGISLLSYISGNKPVKTTTKKRIQEWGLRPGLPIGCKVTLRKKKAQELLIKLLDAKNNCLLAKQFQDGNISFGIEEYIDIPGVNYDPKIGIMGLEVCITLERAGFRVKRRGIMPRKIPQRHKITKQESTEFMEKNFNIRIGEE